MKLPVYHHVYFLVPGQFDMRYSSMYLFTRIKTSCFSRFFSVFQNYFRYNYFPPRRCFFLKFSKQSNFDFLPQLHPFLFSFNVCVHQHNVVRHRLALILTWFFSNADFLLIHIDMASNLILLVDLLKVKFRRYLPFYVRN